MPRLPIKFDNCVIYKIVCNDLNVKELYVGSTTDFPKRKSQHKSSCNNNNNKEFNRKLYEMIRANGNWDNWAMLEIEKFPCNDSNEARTRERYWYEQLNAQLNMIKPIITKEELKEYLKQYREDNKEYFKKYNEDNKDKIKEYNKQYSEDNKDKIKEYYKQYSEDNKDKIKEKDKRYRENNKDTIKEKDKQYREDNKDKIKEYHKQQLTCACGEKFLIGNKARHNKTKKHLHALEKKLLEPPQNN